MEREPLSSEEWQALTVSTWVNALLVLLVLVVLPVPQPVRLDIPPRPVEMVELTLLPPPVPVFGPAGGSPEETARAPRTTAPPAARPRPEPRRTPPARPAASTPVDLPRPVAPTVRRRDGVPPPGPVDPSAAAAVPSFPNPNPDPAADPAPPSPPVQGASDDGGVSATGAPGTGGSSDGGGRGGTGGGSGFGFGGLGSRSVNCALPRNPGAAGRVEYYITFDPDGRYVSSRPKQRGPSSLNQAVSGILRTCRAEPLPEEASQVNQEGFVSFRFTLRRVPAGG